MPDTKIFPNGFASYIETHHEVVVAIAHALENEESKCYKIYERGGTGAMYELGEELTDKFEKLNEGREWDGEFFDEIDAFLKNEL